MFQKNNIIIYTDGSSRGNPGPGGFGFLIVYGKEKVLEAGGKDNETTNNKMELSAAISALKKVSSSKSLSDYKHIEIYADSKYVLQGISTWIIGWKKNNWKTSQKKPVLNQDLWQELDNICETIQKVIPIKWFYVKAHADNVYNNRVDTIATTCADLNETDLANRHMRIFYTGDFDTWFKTLNTDK